MNLLSFFKPKPNRALPQLKFHNTLSGKLEVFESFNSTVRMYNCGPTAYDRQHIGNFFPSVVANILRRILEVWGYSVLEVNNITDFGHISEDEDTEDKMTKGLRREGLELNLKNMRALAEKYAELFFEDLPHLGIDPKKVQYPRASDYIPEQIALVKTLEQKGYAYKTSDGVYFDISKFPLYGKLGSINLMGQQAGARVEENPEKRNPYDFALWKLDRRLGWESPWGLGFPGWHTECVAMIFKLLGRQIDIHMGGIDLAPVHHNNEIAQAEAATGKQFVRYWIHNAHITVEGKKISKSIGNTVYLHNLVDRGLSPRSLRYWFLTGHYRSPTNFTWGAIEGADTALARLQRLFLELPPSGFAPDEKFLNDFYAAVADDLDMPRALARVWDLARDENISPTIKKSSLARADKILGLGLADARPIARLRVVERGDLPEEVRKLVAEREVARASRDFAHADDLRGQMATLGYAVEDTLSGPRITKK